jgi:hypothetical protein
MRRLVCLVVVLAITVGGSVAAQSRQDFSGTWPAPDSSLTIKQDGTTLTVTEGTETRIYKLDGSESRVERIGQRDKSELTAHWRPSGRRTDRSRVRQRTRCPTTGEC